MSSDTPENPFGGFDMNALLQQAQAMQQQMVSAQEELAETRVDGTVGDGLVTVTVSGTGELVAVKIKKDSFDPAEPEDLEDLIVAAFRDARAKADALAAEAARERAHRLGGGLGGGSSDDGPSGPPLGF